MTYASSIHAESDIGSVDRAGIRRALLPTAVGVVAAGGTLTVYGAHDFGEVGTVMGVFVPVVIALFGFLLPRALKSSGGSGVALTLSVVGVALLLPAFWSALPLAFGVAGALLGYAGRNGANGSGKATAAVALGVLAAIGYFAIYVLDALSQAGVTWA